MTSLDTLASKVKRQSLWAKIFFIATLLVIVVSIIVSFSLVSNLQNSQAQISEVVRNYRAFAELNNDLDDQLAAAQPNQEAELRITEFIPESEEITNLTRLFDSLFAEWNTPANPISNNSLSFGTSTFNQETMINILPITLTVSSSVNNFDRLLYTIETSGLPGSDLPFMDVQSISINLQGPAQTDEDVINYTITLNTYYAGNSG